jgi:FkbM family methyltransferase
MLTLIKRLIARLPEQWQTSLKRIHYGLQIRRGSFQTTEPEYPLLPQFVGDGDWAIDIGANVGHYTKRLSELVGIEGRVIAFEPVPTTFGLLSSNVQLFAQKNVTLVNAATSNELGVVGMSIPRFSTGLKDYYDAHISPSSEAALSVLTLPVDSMGINRRVALVKIDAEGHELFVLKGMTNLLKTYHPVLIVETNSNEVVSLLASLGYVANRLPNSPNIIFQKGTSRNE